jgi:hypothetical protein
MKEKRKIFLKKRNYFGPIIPEMNLTSTTSSEKGVDASLTKSPTLESKELNQTTSICSYEEHSKKIGYLLDNPLLSGKNKFNSTNRYHL